MKSSNNSHTIKLWLIIAVAFIPVIVAVSLYFSQAWSPAGRVNEGTLLTPLLSLEKLPLQDSQTGTEVDIIQDKKWQLLLITQDMTDLTNESVHLMRQVHKAIGKNHKRIERNFITLTPPSEEQIKTLTTEYPNMRLLMTQQNDLKSFLSQTPSALPILYICDPLGNIMLSYQTNQIGKPLLKDLKRLLKLSKIG